MRVTRWFIGVSTVAALAAGALAVGCSSSSSSAPATNNDASTETGAEGGEDASCHVDADLTAFAESDAAGSECAACVKANCMAGIMACSTSCACINLFTCLADGGVSASNLGTSGAAALAACVPSNIKTASSLLMDPGISGVFTCFTATCSDACSSVISGLDGGDDGSAAEGGGSTDGGTIADAADGG
jgi:hypothetical protein